MEITEDERWFRRLREAELKHGRVAMLAASGFFAAHVVRMPGFEDRDDEFCKQDVFRIRVVNCLKI